MEASEEKHSYKADADHSWCQFYVVGLAAISVLAAVGYLSTSDRTAAFDCGASVLEARAKKCHFEPMQRAWIPDACYFRQPSDEYDPFADRPWFLDESFEHQADPKTLKGGDVIVAYVADFHQEHCTYNWRKLSIAVDEKRTLVDSRVGNVHHSTHCALGLAEQTKNMSACAAPRAGTLTRSNLNFLKCVSLR